MKKKAAFHLEYCPYFLLIFAVTCAETSKVNVNCLRWNLRSDNIFPLLLCVVHVACCHTKNDSVEYTSIAKFFSLSHSVNGKYLILLGKVFQNLIRVLCSTCDNWHWINSLIIDYQSAICFEEVSISQSLKTLESDENICLTFFYDWLCNFFTLSCVTYISYDRTATLCHSVNF